MPIISGAKGGITVRDLLQIGPAVFRSWMEDKNVADLIDSIRQAKKLRDAGVLTEKESQERIAQLKKDRVDKLELNRQLYEHLQKEYSEKKARLKRLLPYVTYMARFINNIRKNENAIPTGLYIMDYDHVPDPEAIYNAFIKGREGELAIALVHITPSGEGLRIVACTPQGMTIAEAQAWLAEQLGLMDYDKVVRDLARASFMPRKEDLLYYDEELLFCEDLEAELARRGIVLPTGQPEEAPVTPVEAETAAATTAEPSGSTQTYPDTFQGEPYADIAHRCLTANGKKEPVVGERHQRLLWLAELLRYMREQHVLDAANNAHLRPPLGGDERHCGMGMRTAAAPTEAQSAGASPPSSPRRRGTARVAEEITRTHQARGDEHARLSKSRRVPRRFFTAGHTPQSGLLPLH